MEKAHWSVVTHESPTSASDRTPAMDKAGALQLHGVSTADCQLHPSLPKPHVVENVPPSPVTVDRGLQSAPLRTGSASSLLVGALNIQSLKPKMLELTQELHLQWYNVMLLSETWLKPTTPNRPIVIPGSRLTRVDRPDGHDHGGVEALIKGGGASPQHH